MTDGCSKRFQEEIRDCVLERPVHVLLEQSRDPARGHRPAHSAAKQDRRERNRESIQGWICVTPRRATAAPGCLSRGDPGLYRRLRTSLWLDSLLSGSECFNRAATSVNIKCLFPHGVLQGSHLPLPLLPFFQPANYLTPRQWKTEPRIAGVVSKISDTITDAIATRFWMIRRG